MFKSFWMKILGLNKKQQKINALKQEVKDVSQSATKKIDKLNIIMKEGVAFNIYKAAGGVKRVKKKDKSANLYALII